LLVTTLKILQLLGDFVPRPPNGAPSLDTAGDGVPRPTVVLPPSQTSNSAAFDVKTY